ncbi:MAG: nuclear transport factor 2 family protein [Actinobacteria bacterium]|nr:nuclear transport factor 2 family protein [Actinomycetota bacterium]
MRDDPRDVVLRVFDALNDHDLERYAGLLAEDVQERHPYVLDGRDAVTAGDKATLELIPDHWRTIERLLVDGDNVAFWLRFGGTIAATGKSFEVEICGVVEVRDGKIATWNFWTGQAPMQQAMQDGASPSEVD